MCWPSLGPPKDYGKHHSHRVGGGYCQSPGTSHTWLDRGENQVGSSVYKLTNPASKYVFL